MTGFPTIYKMTLNILLWFYTMYLCKEMISESMVEKSNSSSNVKNVEDTPCLAVTNVQTRFNSLSKNNQSHLISIQIFFHLK